MENQSTDCNDDTAKERNSAGPQAWKRVRIIILCFVAVERLAFMRVVLELSYMTTENRYFNYSSVTLNAVDTVFEGFSYFIPLFGGLLGDVIWPREYIVLGSVLTFISGSILIPISVSMWDTRQTIAKNLGIASLALLALAEGGIRANIVVLGVQQAPQDDVGKRASSFFHWYYIALNIGATFALFFEPLRSYGWPGYLLLPVAIVVATIVFLLGWNHYRNVDIEDYERYQRHTANWSTLSRSLSAVVRRRSSAPRGSTDIQENSPILRRDQEDHSVDVNRFKRILKVLMVQGAVILFWANYFQMYGVYDAQSAELLLHHDIIVNHEPLSLHLWMTAFNTFVVLVMIPLFFYVIYPWVEKKRGKPNRLLVKIGAGLGFACLSSAIAVAVEYVRCAQPDPIRHLTIYVQAPILMLLGVAEVLVAISGLEFTHGLLPKALPGLAIGIWYATVGIGRFTLQILMQIARYVFQKVCSATPCYPEYQRNTMLFHLDYYFISILVISLVNLAVFILIALKATRIGGYAGTPEGCLDNQLSHSLELQEATSASRRRSSTYITL